jgi:hypothetical protein
MSGPCLNDAACSRNLTDVRGYVCLCVDGFSGSSCESNYLRILFRRVAIVNNVIVYSRTVRRQTIYESLMMSCTVFAQTHHISMATIFLRLTSRFT